MIIDGRAIAQEIYRETKNRITHLNGVPHLTVFTCAPNFETQRYLALKRRMARSVGIQVNVIEFPDTASTEEIKLSIKQAFMQTDGVVIQLPFPKHIEIDSILAILPPSLDVDAINYDGSSHTVLPPVVGAIKEISERNDLCLATQKVVVVGAGRLVGKPAALWFQRQGAQVSVITKETDVMKRNELIAQADILVLGAGQPGLVGKELVKEGVIVFDGGTSESVGVLVGDADPGVADKASIFTPVPGGIGPITVAVLLSNLVTLVSEGRSQEAPNML